MCETFKSIKLPVVECYKNGLQIPVKVSLANDYQRGESFIKSVKMKVLELRGQLKVASRTKFSPVTCLNPQ